jgi:hypothetical protein
MSKFLFIFLGLAFLFQLPLNAMPLKINGGEIFVGGTAYPTGNHLRYLGFRLVGNFKQPNREIVIYGEDFGVLQEHPNQPIGEYIYTVTMPAHAGRMFFNGELFSPVWMVPSKFHLSSNITTPLVTPDSPQQIELTAPFYFYGAYESLGAYATAYKLKGSGTLRITFEKFQAKYFVLQARYSFAPNSVNNNPAVEKTEETN